MRKTRSFVLGFLTASLALALSACGGTGEAPPADMTGQLTYLPINGVLTRSCAAGGCHGVGNVSMFPLGGGSRENWTTLTTTMGKYGPFLNLAAPEQSNVLGIPSERSAKHPLKAWDAASADYQMVLRWIKAGGPL